jgi:hypothetical protein
MKIEVTGGENKAVQITRGSTAYLMQKNCIIKAVGDTIFLYDSANNLVLSGKFDQFVLDGITYEGVLELFDALTGPDYFFVESTGGGGGLDPGTAEGQLLRWDGSKWTPWSTWRAVNGADSIVDPGVNFGFERQYEEGGLYFTESIGSTDGSSLRISHITSQSNDINSNFVKNIIELSSYGILFIRDSDNTFEYSFARLAKNTPIVQTAFRDVSTLGEKAAIYQNNENAPQIAINYFARYSQPVISPAYVTFRIRDENLNTVVEYPNTIIDEADHISQPIGNFFLFFKPRLLPGWSLQFEVTSEAKSADPLQPTVELISTLVLIGSELI